MGGCLGTADAGEKYFEKDLASLGSSAYAVRMKIEIGKVVRFSYSKDGTGEDRETYTVLVDRILDNRFSGRCVERGGQIRHFRFDRIES